MKRIVRENALCALLAGGASFVMGWLGLYGYAWSDYEVEVQPAFNALTHGHVLEFLRVVPVYGGSLIERAPFALLPGLWGGGQLAVYRTVAVPCLLAGAALGVWLWGRMRATGMSRVWRVVALGICVANPMTLKALETGHPEELLGACLCLAAVLVAARGRAIWAGVLLGLAIANKEWALLAIGPVLLALPVGIGPSTLDTGGPRLRTGALPDSLVRLRARSSRARNAILCLASAGLVTAIVLAPLVLVPGGGFASTTRSVASGTSEIFQPWQAWWFLGWHGTTVHGLFGVSLPGYRHGPAWVGIVSHPLVILIGFALTGALWLRQRQQRSHGEQQADTAPGRDALLLLAFVLLGRCLLDSWDTSYYMLPFSLAVLTWETIGERRRPMLALVGVVVPWLGLEQLTIHGASPDMQSMLFLVWTLPLSALLAWELYVPYAHRTRAVAINRLHGRDAERTALTPTLTLTTSARAVSSIGGIQVTAAAATRPVFPVPARFRAIHARLLAAPISPSGSPLTTSASAQEMPISPLGNPVSTS
jgi:hypothetical protein